TRSEARGPGSPSGHWPWDLRALHTAARCGTGRRANFAHSTVRPRPLTGFWRNIRSQISGAALWHPRDGVGRRTLLIPTFEDKILQRAVTMVLEAVDEQDFLDCSYG